MPVLRLPTLAASVILLLDPELCCDSFRSKGLVARGLDFFPELVAPADLAFPFVLSGPVFRLALDRPPLPEFRHPFHCSVPLAQASRQAAWHEAACDTRCFSSAGASCASDVSSRWIGACLP